ncbi:hypothetical protein, partial [Enterococcus faecium]|uniref:hypothetical protein n=1 Tax=Enterococcus faecium TaxID=1352 RepID=UPI001CE04423
NDEILTRWNLEKIITNRVRGIDSNPVETFISEVSTGEFFSFVEIVESILFEICVSEGMFFDAEVPQAVSNNKFDKLINRILFIMYTLLIVSFSIHLCSVLGKINAKLSSLL